MRGGQAGDLGHRSARLAGLDVGDVHVDARSDVARRAPLSLGIHASMLRCPAASAYTRCAVLSRPISAINCSISPGYPGEYIATDRSLIAGQAHPLRERRRQFEPNSSPRIVAMSWRSPNSRTTSRWSACSK